MANIKQMSQEYTAPKTKNIADLDKVSVDLDVSVESFTDKEGKPFDVNVVDINGSKYRIPTSVLKDLKAILEVKPRLKTFKVAKQGTGLDTKYTVIPLD